MQGPGRNKMQHGRQQNSRFMKAITILLLVLIFLSCGQRSPPKEDVILPEAVTKNSEGTLENTDPVNLPNGFTLDTFSTVDKERNTEIFISIPLSNIASIDSIVRAEIENQKNDFLKSLDRMIHEDKRILSAPKSNFYVELISVYQDDKLISYCFIISYYHAGAAHPMTMYYSSNYNMKSKRKIGFGDYFNLNTKADTLFFTNIISQAINRKGVHVSNLQNIDMNIEKDTISFNFDAYELTSYAAGIIRGRISKNELKDKIKDL